MANAVMSAGTAHPPGSAHLAGAVPADLQMILDDLIELGLLAKHAHWNVTGPGFAPLHALLDDIAAVASGAADLIAERLRALDCYADGLTPISISERMLPSLPAGRLRDTQTVDAFTAILGTISERLRRSIAVAGDDPVSQDALIGITHDIDKRAWLVRAHR